MNVTTQEGTVVAASAPIVILRNSCPGVVFGMKRLGLLSFVIIALTGLSQPAHGRSRARGEDFYYPTGYAYESFGRVQIVRQVQLALEQNGYYTGDNRGNFCFETRWAVRRYKRDVGLPITGKIDAALLEALGLR